MSAITRAATAFFVGTEYDSPFVQSGGVKLTLIADVTPPDGLSAAKIDETRVALRELGMSEDVDVKSR